MMAPSHAVIGAAVWLAVAPHLSMSPVAPLGLAICVLGALAPDIDHPKSWVGRRSRPVSDIISAVFSHRGITHSALAILLFAWLLVAHAPLAGAARTFIVPFAVGWVSHLAADALTPGGLRLTWPMRRTYCIPLCRTGSTLEPFLVIAAVTCILWWGGYGRTARLMLAAFG